MKPQSAKGKGRRLQQWVRDALIRILNIHPEDIESRSMGAGGEDLILARAARDVFPYSVECKNTERVNVWLAYDQACANANDYTALLIIKKNKRQPLAIVDASYFISLHRQHNGRQG